MLDEPHSLKNLKRIKHILTKLRILCENVITIFNCVFKMTDTQPIFTFKSIIHGVLYTAKIFYS